MSGPFVYPSEPHTRRHGPIGYAAPVGFRPWLRDEFEFRCVYCLRRERWGRSVSEFAIDHFLPVVTRPDLLLVYSNLLYACEACNTRKGDQIVADPLATLLADTISFLEDGRVIAATRPARHLVMALQLDSPEAVEFRATWIRVLRLASRFDPLLYRDLLAYPDDLPDLAALRPPGGNALPDGIVQSHFARRSRGELPEFHWFHSRA